MVISIKNKRILKIFAAVITIILLVLCLSFYKSSESPFPLYPFIDTIFAKDFSWEGYNAIKTGINKSDVKSLLGEPVGKFTPWTMEPHKTCWMYSTDGKLWPYADFSWFQVLVCFNNEKVESKVVHEYYD